MVRAAGAARNAADAAPRLWPGSGAGRTKTVIRLLLRILIPVAILLSVVFQATTALGEIAVTASDPRAPIEVAGQYAAQWQQGQYEVWHIGGNCEIRQGNLSARGREAVLWVDRSDATSGRPHKVVAYLEGDVSVASQHSGAAHGETRERANEIRDQHWLGRFRSSAGVNVHVVPSSGEPRVKPAVYQRGLDAHWNEHQQSVQPAQFTQPETVPTPGPTTPRRILVQPRGTIGITANSETIGQEQITQIVTGVKVTIEGLNMPGQPASSKIVILADRVVIWTPVLDGLNVTRETVQSGETPLEFYLEGNVVFAQGDRVVYAERMFYNVSGRYGTILNAEVLTSVPSYSGLLRLKARVVQQIDEQNLMAYGAAVTSSQIGFPRYWLQTGNVALHDEQVPLIDPLSGQPIIDPRTNAPAIDHNLQATSRNNFIYVSGVPVFYWPVMATNLQKPTYYIDRFSIKSDSVFGTQVLTDFDAFQLLGIQDVPEGTDWNLTFDYLSQRGFGVGTAVLYNRPDFFGFGGPTGGRFDFWGIDDHGLDNLGRDRRALVPEKDLRGRFFWQHRQDLPLDFQLTAEFGLISDGNFLEQYYEREWDTDKDQTTDVHLSKLIANHSFNLTGAVRLNDFFTQTEWLPRADHFMLGQAVLFDRLTWHAHSHVGYGRIETASLSTNPADPMNSLAWEQDSGGVQYADRQGIRAGTRQELDLPLAAGPFKLVPYVLGDVTHWGEDIDGDDVTRAYGQAGVRASIPVWKANPSIQSLLFNLNGMAHKIVYEGEFFWADANEDLTRFPLYDPVDDDSNEAFRRRFLIPSGPFFPQTSIPLRFDERFYAMRAGMQGWVAAPSAEIADDLMVGRVAVRQRWQTKRGLPGNERIVDWVALDVEGAFFPRAERDNFGSDTGQLNYDFRWHVGDRVTVLSDGFYDTFGQGLRTTSVGGFLNRPEVGNVYVGFRWIEGPISANVLTASASYRLSHKWIATAGTSFDFTATGNIGQSLAVTRVGESFLFQFGVRADASRGNISAVFSIEPRFLPSSRLGMVGGVGLPPLGSRGLE